MDSPTHSLTQSQSYRLTDHSVTVQVPNRHACCMLRRTNSNEGHLSTSGAVNTKKKVKVKPAPNVGDLQLTVGPLRHIVISGAPIDINGVYIEVRLFIQFHAAKRSRRDAGCYATASVSHHMYGPYSHIGMHAGLHPKWRAGDSFQVM